MRVAHLDVGGVDIAYRDFGGTEPIPVVLVHGMGGDSGTWDRFATALVAAGRRVVTVDLRGHGRSSHTDDYSFASFGRDIVAVLDHLGLTEVDLVGHSLGGYAVTLVAQERPSSVRSLVIEEMPIPIRQGDAEPTLTGRLPSITELWHAATSILRHPRAVFVFDRSMTGPALAQFRRPNSEWWKKLADITAATLVLRGGPGGMMDDTRLDLLAGEIPDCSVVSFRTGHSIHRDKYAEFEAAVMPFLMRHRN
ncbi:alpha/beta hydrolase [Rhodococcus sp. BP-252]|uniref:Hydrolase n=1 Tax=Rhodococcoides kyotonense TaxID=398843 RepID=A0A177Y661_9NOCA|nr:alpha/beta hydrolase [Rhodococcus sp. BP-320]MBY6417875.1 alpha/beta hydrolase [Rhodococcus sp. BP-321]MBY6422870.1 alpha/beta hydrolase [Rhodococcus sp. BP-324]MBY6425136.1 alpha/beta hydrolase [Rhodococcus sp. BP-323]MBY6430158.1 alpha/beta hydrolase [Rhodococcus sp. BP-322]MBY6439033.1 alpha/beta hydrolase [Rhodococcus sp. BP-319]MBY6443995.1 alpha/beta hydrolase [Rhodococcus sp. BP-318]MBY6448706.1 alpha/beta hydrolase [Rhodococcus sp. BP-315]MBY6453320.1 alpha/beta hydrolase [Rhodoc